MVDSFPIPEEEVRRTVAPERVLRIAPADLSIRAGRYSQDHRGGLLVLTERALTYVTRSPVGLHFPFQATRGELAGMKAKRNRLTLTTTRGSRANLAVQAPEEWTRELETWQGT